MNDSKPRGTYRTDAASTKPPPPEPPPAGTFLFREPDEMFDDDLALAASVEGADLTADPLVAQMYADSLHVVVGLGNGHRVVVPVTDVGYQPVPNSATVHLVAFPYHPHMYYTSFLAAVTAARDRCKSVAEVNASAELALGKLAAALVAPYNPPSAEERPAPGVAHPPPS